MVEGVELVINVVLVEVGVVSSCTSGISSGSGGGGGNE